MTPGKLAVLLLVACASPALAQISIPIPGTGGNIQVGPQDQQRDNRGYDNRGYGGGSSIRVLDANYGRNCRVQMGRTNVVSDIAQACQGRDYCQYYIDVNRLGDPAPGCAKEYQARFVCRDGGNEIWATARAEASGQSVTLDCRRR
jgi:hypothetical protein